MPAGLDPILRSHRIRVGLYDLVEGRLTRTEQIELDLVGARTELPQLAGRRASDLLLINDDDLTFAKIRLDGRSLGHGHRRTSPTSTARCPGRWSGAPPGT